jgi:hypothetical protein
MFYSDAHPPPAFAWASAPRCTLGTIHPRTDTFQDNLPMLLKSCHFLFSLVKRDVNSLRC